MRCGTCNNLVPDYHYDSGKIVYCSEQCADKNDELREELRELIEQWREKHAEPLRNMGRLEEYRCIESCADELEELLND